MDPWGADTNRSNNTAFQPKTFTGYERDGNGGDEAMFRRFNHWNSRFDQPDPNDGSYSLSDPQSFNRYAYVQNDPVNFVDPTGLLMIMICEIWLDNEGGGWQDDCVWVTVSGGSLIPIDPNPRGREPKPIDPEIIKQAFSDCISELYPQYAIVSFTPTTSAANGVTRIKDVKTGSEGDIVSDSTPPPEISKEMADHHARGLTRSDNPWWTYATSFSNSPEARPGEKRYPDLFMAPGMDYVRTQLHETGAALTMIRDNNYPAPWARPPNDLDPNHGDDGPAMEDCVGRKVYAKLGLTPVR